MRIPTLKQYGDLRASDFAREPAWINVHGLDEDEPWYDDDTVDEETFRPWTGGLPVGPEEGMLLVAAAFRAADGEMYDGFATPTFGEGDIAVREIGAVQPVLFTPDGAQVAFWAGLSRDLCEAGRATAYASLKKTGDELFPMRFTSKPGLTLGRASGEIPGFCCLEFIDGAISDDVVVMR